MVYLELIEFRCCKLNFYLKKNIIERSRTESKSDIYEEEKKEKEEKENIKILDDLYIVNYNDVCE